jgi:imidazolonepropionase-like amidohydrolase
VTLLKGGRFFDAAAGKMVDGDVLLDGELIAEVGVGIARPGAVELDVVGMTVLPGLINMHEHFTIRHTWGPTRQQHGLADPYLVIRAVRASLTVLKQGITTVRELGAKHHLNVYMKRAIAENQIPGPRVYAAGSPISITGGHAWRLSTEADGPEGMRRAVRETIKAGADWIKLIGSNDPIAEPRDGQHTHPEIGPDEYRAAADAAHLWGNRITAHAMGRDSIRWAIDGGVDSIEHGIYMDRDLAKRMVDADTALIPTLSGYQSTTTERWSRGEDWIRRHKALPEPHKVSTRIAIEAGVRIAVGTDSVGDYVDELERLVECGMTPAQALTAATLSGAEILGKADQLGSVDVGKAADLVIVRGNPVDDLSVVRDVAFVVQGGIVKRPDEIVLSIDDESASWNSLSLA